ncbi:MAG TPA: indole-3-glycerol phosphate synthase TrpC [Chloroflexota bacterium]
MTTLRTDSVLDRIVELKRRDLAEEVAEQPLAALRAEAERAPRPPDFAAALRTGVDVALIGEIKRASPSKGALAQEVDPVALARRYVAAGADAISVLTERHRFLGSLDDLRAVRRAVDAPLLRKDFLFDPYHLYQARAAGAAAALLIVAMLEQSALVDLIGLTEAIGLTPLVEVHVEDEVERALAAGARVVGINNRSLHTFEVDLAVTERLRPLVPADRTVVGESGVFTRSDVERLRAAGVDAILVGEALMRAGLDGVEGKVAELKGRAVIA